MKTLSTTVSKLSLSLHLKKKKAIDFHFQGHSKLSYLSQNTDSLFISCSIDFFWNSKMMGADSPFRPCQRAGAGLGQQNKNFPVLYLNPFNSSKVYPYTVLRWIGIPHLTVPPPPYRCHLSQFKLYLSSKLWFQCRCLLGPSLMHPY